MKQIFYIFAAEPHCRLGSELLLYYCIYLYKRVGKCNTWRNIPRSNYYEKEYNNLFVTRESKKVVKGCKIMLLGCKIMLVGCKIMLLGCEIMLVDNAFR